MSYEFADRLVELRRAKGMSQEELASALGLSRQAVSKWERAESAPDIGNLVAISELYGVSLDEIVRGQEPAAKQEEAPSAEASEDASEQLPEEPAESASQDSSRGRSEQPSEPTAAAAAVAEAPAPAQQSAYDQAYGAGSGQQAAVEGAPSQDAPPAPAPTAPAAPAPAARTSRAWQIFPYPLLCVVIFLFLGFFFNLWHPGWIVFLTIPFYYWVVSIITHDPNYISDHRE